MQLIVLEQKEWRTAAIEIDNEITDIWGEPLRGVKPVQGDVILGRVSAVLDGKSAAFVSLGSGKPGLLNDDELVLAQLRKTAGGAKPAVSECVEEGQAILVQVKHQGVNRKGPIVTELVHLTGQRLVYMPYAGYSAVSKQLSSRRDELLAFAQHHCVEQEGLIFRTGAGYARETQLQEELENHREEWHQIQAKGAQRRAPTILKKAGGLSEQIGSLFPLLRVTRFVTNSSSAAEEFLPSLSTDVDVSIVPQQHKVISKLEETLENLTKTVKIGKANLHIQETHALTAIDVDTGGANFGSKSDTHFEVNVMAIEELAKQLRLRNIGGIIVVDFLRVPEEDQKRMMTLLKEKEKTDPRLQVGGFTKLGLFELQRKKAGLPLSELICKREE